MTVNGLATVNLSTLTGFQQAIMFVLMWIGHPITISIIVIQFRMWMFEDHLEPLVQKRREEREAREKRNALQGKWPQRVLSVFSQKSGANNRVTSDVELAEPEADTGSVKRGRLKVSMIRRIGTAPQRINPSGHVMGSSSVEPPTAAAPDHTPGTNSGHVFSESPRSLPAPIPEEHMPSIEIKRPTEDGTYSDPTDSHSMHRTPTVMDSSFPNAHPRRAFTDHIVEHGLSDDVDPSPSFPRVQTVEFAISRPVRTTSVEREGRPNYHGNPPHGLVERREGSRMGRTETSQTYRTNDGFERYPPRNFDITRTATGASKVRKGSRHTGFGGFPTPYRLLIKFVSWVAPDLAERIRLRLTVPRTPSVKLKHTKSIASQTIEAALQKEHKLIEKDLEFLGGVEYQSLKLLRTIVIAYHIGIQIIGYALVIGDATRKKWLPVFTAQPRFVPPTWFAVFQVTSAYTNTGTSLSDQSMIPFQSARLMIITMFFLILAGNTAFLLLANFVSDLSHKTVIWILKKCFPRDSPIQAPLHFLLKHPRRCFIYLFPSHQTWFLLTMIVTLTLTDWLCFLILDIGNPVTEAVPLPHRVLIGLLQAAAVRAAGFSTISLSALAPAVKVLYVIMMYVSVYPIAMSVRSTNVYEEKSLGIFNEAAGNDSEDSSLLSDEEKFRHRRGESRTKIWGEYLLWHARQQLAFDMWWLALALWLICIIERNPLSNPDNQTWFNIFPVIFEIVSAYGTVGMSLGIPFDNYSTCGVFHPLSKLIIIAVMIRGRHRGLPVAIDRAIVLPNEFNKKIDNEEPIIQEQTNSQGIRTRPLDAVPESLQATPAMNPMTGESRPVSPSALSFPSTIGSPDKAHS
ncbi:TrkH-domain-containing protein [Serendipita vermifera]|nr:TrkH-domain-containing protein [Serendipita vermifera]